MELVIKPVQLEFGFKDLSLEKVFGTESLNSLLNPIELFKSQIAPRSGSVESFAVNFDWAFGGAEIGLGLDFEVPSLGEIDLIYPIQTTLNTPEFVEPGSEFQIGTGIDFYSTSPEIKGETLNFGGLKLNLIASLGSGSLSDISFLNAFGYEAFPLEGQAIKYDGLPSNQFTLLEIKPGFEIGTSFDDIEIAFTLPQGTESSKKGVTSSGPGTLEPLTLEVGENLVSIKTNVLELLDDIPALAPLDAFQEDFGPFDFNFFGENYSLTSQYTIFSVSLAGGYGLVQRFEFIPGKVAVTFSVNGTEEKGFLGDSFSFLAPNELRDSISGEVTYQFTGKVNVSYALKPIGSIGFDILSGELKLKETSNALVNAQFGPLFSGTASGSTSLGSIDVFSPDSPIDLGFDVFKTITRSFNIPTVQAGQDIAFVIDTTGSMADDIASVKARASEIINAVFESGGKPSNSRVSVVGYNDPSTNTFLSFTDQPKIADRKIAALNAINSISVGGGGDLPEAVNAGLIRALDGRAGQWREDAVVRRIILFGDAPPKDTELRARVLELARNIRVNVPALRTSGTPLAISDTFETTALSDDLAVTRFDLLEVAADGTERAVPVEIFTVLIGNDRATAADFASLSQATGGRSFNAANASEVVDVLIKAIQSTSNTAPVAIDDNGLSTTLNTSTVLSTDNLLANDIDADGDVLRVLSVSAAVNGNVLLNADRTITFTPTPFFLGAASFDYTISDGVATDIGKVTLNVSLPSSAIGGTEKNDILNGSGADDIIAGLDGDDNLNGNGGNDILLGGNGNDLIFGGTGNDQINAGAGGSNLLFGNEGKNSFLGGTGNEVAYAGAGDDDFNLGDGSNRLYAGEGNNQIETGFGGDLIYSGAGQDLVYAGDGDNVIFAGEGNNNIATGAGADRITTGSGNDVINAGDGGNVVTAGEGNNSITTGSSADLIYAGAGNDTILTGAGNDLIYAGEGNNVINSGVGDDLIYSGLGSDIFTLNKGDGMAMIIGFQSIDKFALGSGLTKTELSVMAIGSDTLIAVGSDYLAMVKGSALSGIAALTIV
jgi:Ca2+-binding RTX toxin-like protein